jgi:hypothetical protein
LHVLGPTARLRQDLGVEPGDVGLAACRVAGALDRRHEPGALVTAMVSVSRCVQARRRANVQQIPVAPAGV